jgi:hypothetical protein
MRCTAMQRNAFRIGLSVAVLGIVLGATGRAEAGPVTYDISGSFGNDILGSTGLAGGSFSGSFTTSGLPVTPGHTASFSAYDIDVYDSHHSLVLELKSTDLNSSEIIGLNTGSKRTELLFDRLAVGKPNVFAMEIYFPTPFNGNGSLVPYNFFNLQSSQFQVASLFGHTGFGRITSGQAFAATPEPSTLALGLVGVLGGLGYVWRRRDVLAA